VAVNCGAGSSCGGGSTGGCDGGSGDGGGCGGGSGDGGGGGGGGGEGGRSLPLPGTFVPSLFRSRCGAAVAFRPAAAPALVSSLDAA